MSDPVDTLVVGAGCAGLAAAVEAAAGGRVLVIEAGERPGGSSALAVGSITASATSLQRWAGIDDRPEDHLEDLLACVAGDEISRAALPDERWRLELLAAESGAGVEWLAGIGVRFSGPHPEPPHRVPRMHNAVPGGDGLVAGLAAEARRRGVELRYRVRALGLLVEDGRVRGVRAQDADGRTLELRAEAPVLAAGDASAAVAADWPGGPVRAINRRALGDGATLASEAGAATFEPRARVQLRVEHPPHSRPSDELLAAGAVLVGEDGRPFADEDEDPAQAAVARGVGRAWAVFDSSVAARLASPADDSGPRRRDGWLRSGRPFVATMGGIGYAYLDDALERGIAVSAGSPGELADRTSLPVRALERLAAPAEAPLYAVGPLVPAIVLSDGAIDTDREMRVLRPDGSPVDGLLAAGSSAWGRLIVAGHGQHLAWALVSGRRAGHAAAASALARRATVATS